MDSVCFVVILGSGIGAQQCGVSGRKVTHCFIPSVVLFSNSVLDTLVYMSDMVPCLSVEKLDFRVDQPPVWV